MPTPAPVHFSQNGPVLDSLRVPIDFFEGDPNPQQHALGKSNPTNGVLDSSFWILRTTAKKLQRSRELLIRSNAWIPGHGMPSDPNHRILFHDPLHPS
jgi:hypothetical protein